MASFSSMEIQVDAGVSIPYHNGLAVGHVLDFTTELGKRRTLITDRNTPITSKMNYLSCKFSMANSLSAVCEVLGIPYEYALKVEAGLLHNQVVKACMRDIYNRQAFKVIFTLRYIQEKHHFFSPVSFREPIDPVDKQRLSFDLRVGGRDTHLVDALYIGDELVVIMTIASQESDALQSFKKKIEKTLGKSPGQIGEGMTDTLETMGASLDSKLSKSHYKNVNCVIEYGSFVDLDTYPASVSGMVGVMKNFREKWKCIMDPAINSGVSFMKLKTGTDQEAWRGDAMRSQKNPELFYLRVTLQPNISGEKATPTLGMDDGSKVNENIFACLCAVNKTDKSLLDFLKKHEHRLASNLDYKLKVEELQHKFKRRKNELLDVIRGLDMVESISEKDIHDLRESIMELRESVEDFGVKVTTKLPVGGDLNLLIIGKTGHGKSSTANTILGRNEFHTSSGGISDTKKCQRAWADIDGRTFKVVDIPGVCDTDMGSLESVKLAMDCITEAITHSSEGFHALLLVIRYGNRMTEEEERAIYILKCILGSTIVHSHCICVVTHGDNFDESGGSFDQWCKEQVGSLKDLFEECNYRCVLFNNKATDLKVKKTQLIELVSKVDSLEHIGFCYTNDIFKHAKQNRDRLIEELKLPEFKEETMRDLNLLQGEFENIDNADKDGRKAAIDSLKFKVESLRNKLDTITVGRVSDLHQAISNFAERLSRTEEKELVDAQFQLEREKFKQEELNLRAKKEEMERKVAEQTKERVREAALAAETREREIRDLEAIHLEDEKRRKEELETVKEEVATTYSRKSRWVTIRDSIVKW